MNDLAAARAAPRSDAPPGSLAGARAAHRAFNLLDTIGEVLLVYLALIGVCTTLAAVAEGWNLADALWWAAVTASTTGYGDLAPHTGLARVAAAALMIGAWVLNVILAGLVAAKLIVNSDAWTHEEQEGVKADLAEIRRLLAAQAKAPAGDGPGTRPDVEAGQGPGG